jgi:uncharacterized phage protein (predicted DNA packaging)
MILDLALAKAQMNVSSIEDDDLIERKIAAAQNHIESLLGYEIEEKFGGTDQDPIPPALIEAVAMLTAHLYENREATLVGVNAQPLPFGIDAVVTEYRQWSWGAPDAVVV